MTTTTVMQSDSYGEPDLLAAVEKEVPAPGPGEVTIEVRAAGVNPTDFKLLAGAYGPDPSLLPIVPGNEIAGVISAIGEATEIASGGGAVGDAVLAFRVRGGYAGAVTMPAKDVFAKPEVLDFPEAANLLLVATTAADMQRVVPVHDGDTVVVHGASGAVGVNLLQQLHEIGVRAIGTCGRHNFETVERFGGVPVEYGDGLERRLRDLSPHGYSGAFDCVGTDEAIDVSLALVPADRLVTITGFERARTEGFHFVVGRDPVCAQFRDSVRADLIARAARGELVVPMARTWPLTEAADALRVLQQEHPGGKLALIP